MSAQWEVFECCAHYSCKSIAFQHLHHCIVTTVQQRSGRSSWVSPTQAVVTGGLHRTRGSIPENLRPLPVARGSLCTSMHTLHEGLPDRSIWVVQAAHITSGSSDQSLLPAPWQLFKGSPHPKGAENAVTSSKAVCANEMLLAARTASCCTAPVMAAGLHSVENAWQTPVEDFELRSMQRALTANGVLLHAGLSRGVFTFFTVAGSHSVEDAAAHKANA
jgi:hypothetical protein